MKIINCTQVSFKGSKSDLSFVNKIRDIDVQRLDSLQKSKIEILLKFREAKKIVDSYRANIQDLLENNLEKYAISAKKYPADHSAGYW